MRHAQRQRIKNNNKNKNKAWQWGVSNKKQPQVSSNKEWRQEGMDGGYGRNLKHSSEYKGLYKYENVYQCEWQGLWAVTHIRGGYMLLGYAM